jgi:hypothetical protein
LTLGLYTLLRAHWAPAAHKRQPIAPAGRVSPQSRVCAGDLHSSLDLRPS